MLKLKLAARAAAMGPNGGAERHRATGRRIGLRPQLHQQLQHLIPAATQHLVLQLLLPTKKPETALSERMSKHNVWHALRASPVCGFGTLLAIPRCRRTWL